MYPPVWPGSGKVRSRYAGMSMMVTALDVLSVSPVSVKRETRLMSMVLPAGEWYRYT
jgi:hypothetical protein